MAFGGYLTISMLGFLALLLAYSAVGISPWARRWPILMLLLGITIAVLGVLLSDIVSGYEWAISEACKSSETLSDCAASKHYADMFRKIVEIGFAAVGAGLVALSIDIRSDIAFDEVQSAIEQDEFKLLEARDKWLEDFEKLGSELESITGKQRIERFEALRRRIINLGEKAHSLSDRREALKPWTPARLLSIPTIMQLRQDKLKGSS